MASSPHTFPQLPEGTVELLEHRGRRHKHFDLPDGRRHAFIGIDDFHYKHPELGWQDILLGWDHSGEHPVSAQATAVVTVKPDGLHLHHHESLAGIHWHAAGLTTSETHAHHNHQGLDWSWELLAAGIKLSAAVTANRGVQTYSWDFTLLGDAGILAIDVHGNLIADEFVIPAPTVVDANRKRRRIPWRLVGSTASFDLDDTDLAVPYTIDPTTNFSPSLFYDCYGGGASYPPAFYTFPGFSDIQASNSKNDGRYGFTYGIDVAMMNFNTSSLGSGATVNTADLQYNVNSHINTDSRNFVLEWHVGSSNNSGDYTTSPGNNAGSINVGSVTNTTNIISLSSPSNVSVTGTSGLRAGVDGSTPTGINEVDILSSSTLLSIGYTPPNVAPANTVLPSVSGTTKAGSTLTSTTGTWTGTPTPTYTYQWRRCDASGANPVDIGGATSSTYVLTSLDVQSTILCKVTATNTVSSVAASSAVTALITAPPSYSAMMAAF